MRRRGGGSRSALDIDIHTDSPCKTYGRSRYFIAFRTAVLAGAGGHTRKPQPDSLDIAEAIGCRSFDRFLLTGVGLRAGVQVAVAEARQATEVAGEALMTHRKLEGELRALKAPGGQPAQVSASNHSTN